MEAGTNMIDGDRIDAGGLVLPPKAPGAKRDGYLLHDQATLAQIARDAVNLADRLGASHAMASVTESAGVTMKVRGGVPENAVRDGGQSLSIKVFDDGRTGTATTSALTADAIRMTVERAVTIARQVEPDRDAALPEPEWLLRSATAVELYAPSQLSPTALGETAASVEQAAIDAASRNSCEARVLEAGASSHDWCSALAIGRDFDRSNSASHQGRWCVAIAERDGAMTRDWWASTDRRTDRLLPAAVVGATAVTRAARKLGARTLETQVCPVLMDATVASSMIGELAGALMGMAQHQKATFFAGALGKQVVADHLDLMEDPLEPFGLASGDYDGEGVGGAQRHVVRAGVVEGYFLSSLSARKLGLKSTGNANGVWNLTLRSRRTLEHDDLDAMLRRLDRGLWVTELIGGAVNPVTGAYSKAAAGFWVENGTASFPVQDITIAGDLPTMLAGIEAVGGDVYRSEAVRTGSILLDRMHIAGR